MKSWVPALLVLLGMAGCSGPAAVATPLPAMTTPSPVVPVAVEAAVTPAPLPVEAATTAEPTLDATLQAVSTPVNRLPPERWKEWPVIPTLSERARLVYQRGVAAGRNPQAFSKVGDCESRTTWFLADFDRGSQYYSLGEFDELQATIDYFDGSYERLSVAAKQGFTAASLLSPLWGDPQLCQKNEAPLACEFRLHRPAFALIMMGTNDAVNKKTFESNMRRVVLYTLNQGVVPVLTTKADNLEKDESINATLAKLAYEYDVPFWNFWLAVQPLPGHGLQPDKAHLTWGYNRFDNPEALKKAWPVRNLTALQVLEALRQQAAPSKQ